MARDAALFEAFERGEIPPTLRLYEWASPAITYGVNQRLPEGLVQAAQQLNIPLFRRPTGGKAVLHGHDLTLALVANLPSAPDSPHPTRLYPRQVYLALVPAFIQAFRQLGIPASMGDAPAPHPTHLHDGGDCFATPCAHRHHPCRNGRQADGMRLARVGAWFSDAGVDSTAPA
jgi:lipoate-protein ligase A